MASRRPLVAGNWKMNGLKASLAEIAAIGQGYDGALQARADVLICPPATLLAAAAAQAAGSGVAVGGQDCHTGANGAHTGDVAAEMLADAGATYVIVGHSERRADHGESNATVRGKAEAGFRAGLTTIVCVGETQAERAAGRALAVIGEQLAGSVPQNATASRLVLAYEPVWAIGTGLTPTAADIAEAHAFIRETLERLLPGQSAGVRILYGGSVKPGNAAELMSVANVDGALVGGASLKAAEFLAIADVYR
jgi:triosephosphate isomerase